MANNRYNYDNDRNYSERNRRDRSLRSSSYRPDEDQISYEPNYQGFRNYDDDSRDRDLSAWGRNEYNRRDSERGAFDRNNASSRDYESYYRNRSNDDDYRQNLQRDFNRDDRDNNVRDYGSSEYYGQGAGDMRSRGYTGQDYNYMPGRSYGPYGQSSQNSMFGSPDSMSFGRERSRSGMSDMGYAGRGPKGYRRSDERIHEEVCESLERDPYVDASEIEVKVKDGIVTFSGTVENRRAKRHAEDAVEDISGIKDIRNELSVDQSLFEQAKEMITGETKNSKTSKNTSGTRH